MNILSRITEVLYFPFFVFAVISTIFYFRKNKSHIVFSCLIVVFGLLFRVSNDIQSKRYYSAAIILSIFPIAFFFRDRANRLFKHRVIIFFTFFLACFIKIFSHSRNMEEFYIRDTINRINSSYSNYTLIAPDKIIKRYEDIHPIKSFKTSTDYKSSLLRMIDKYMYCGDLIVALNTSDIADFSNNYSLLFDRNHLLRIAAFSFGKRKKNHYSIFAYIPHLIKSSSNDVSNLLRNGDIETQISQPQVRILFRQWINDNALFYDNDTLLFPKNDVILNTWSPLNGQYPKVFSDSTSPINGSYSLHCTSSYPFKIFLFNKIEPHSGYLSFKIKNLSNDNLSFTLECYNYDDNNKIILSDRTNCFSFFDNKIHEVVLYFDKECFVGSSALFLLDVSPSDFLIDDIAYYTL